MKVLITGLTGFVGKSLQEELPLGHDYFALTRSDQELEKRVHALSGDLEHLDRVRSRIRKIRPDICIHLAWDGIPYYGYATSRNNLMNSMDLFHFLVTECGCRKIVAAGSCWEYGKDSGPCREDEPIGSGNYFVWAKNSLLNFGLTAARKENITFAWLRLFYVYGPGQHSGSLIPTLARALRRGECPEVKAPLNANDFVYVADAAQAFVKAAFNEVSSGIYNVGSGASTPVWHVCELLERALDKRTSYFKQLKTAAGKAATDFWADTVKAREILQWSAGTSLEQGIGKYLDFNGRED